MFPQGTESSSKPGSADATYLLCPHQQNVFLPDEVREPLPQSLGDRELPQNFTLEMRGSWGRLRGSSP